MLSIFQRRLKLVHKNTITFRLASKMLDIELLRVKRESALKDVKESLIDFNTNAFWRNMPMARNYKTACIPT